MHLQNRLYWPGGESSGLEVGRALLSSGVLALGRSLNLSVLSLPHLSIVDNNTCLFCGTGSL